MMTFLHFWDCVDRIYLIELEIKNTTDTTLPKSRHWQWGSITTKAMLSIFPMNVNFPLTFVHVATFQQHLHMEYLFLGWYDTSELVVFFNRGLLLTKKLLKQGYPMVKLMSSLRRVYCHHHDLVNSTEYICHKWLRIMFYLS